MDAFQEVIVRNRNYEMERVEIDLPFHEESMAAIFQDCGLDDAPVVLQVPGMGLCKEVGINPVHNRFVRRGMHVLTIVGPGQGETRLRGVADETHETYQRAGQVAIDWLTSHPSVDETKSSVDGVSMGTYWGGRIASTDDRVAAVALHMGCWYSKDLLFDQTQSFFKKRFMYMSDITDDDEFDEHASEMTLHGLDCDITAPVRLLQASPTSIRRANRRRYSTRTAPDRNVSKCTNALG